MDTKKLILIITILLCTGCFAPKAEKPTAEKKDVSAAITSFFEPTAAQKSRVAEMKDLQTKRQQQNERLQKERVQSY